MVGGAQLFGSLNLFIIIYYTLKTNIYKIYTYSVQIAYGLYNLMKLGGGGGVPLFGSLNLTKFIYIVA